MRKLDLDQLSRHCLRVPFRTQPVRALMGGPQAGEMLTARKVLVLQRRGTLPPSKTRVGTVGKPKPEAQCFEWPPDSFKTPDLPHKPHHCSANGNSLRD